MEAEATVELNPPESKEPAEQAQDKQVSLELLNSLPTKYNGYCHGKHEYKWTMAPSLEGRLLKWPDNV